MPKNKLICIFCKKKPRNKGDLFCPTCRDQDIFKRIKAFKKSRHFHNVGTVGWTNKIDSRKRRYFILNHQKTSHIPLDKPQEVFKR